MYLAELNLKKTHTHTQTIAKEIRWIVYKLGFAIRLKNNSND